MSLAAVILLIVSGVAGVSLTVWGRIMPPETPATKRGFVAVGGISVICIIAAGVLNVFSQDRLRDTIETMAGNIQKLAPPANVQKNLSIDEILAAAASKLRDQNAQIQKLQSEVKGIMQPADALYLNKTVAAGRLGRRRGLIRPSPFNWSSLVKTDWILPKNSSTKALH